LETIFLLLLKVSIIGRITSGFCVQQLRKNNGAIFNLFHFEALNYHMQDKKRSKKIISEKYRFLCVQVSFNYSPSPGCFFVANGQ
jgi:hypothetical protein